MASTETLASVVRARYFAENGSAGYPLPPADVAYLERAFVTLDTICVGRSQTPDELRQAMLDGRLPRPAYLRDDGTELVPVDYLALADAAGGVDALPAAFAARWRAVAGPDDQHGAEEWEAYLSGHYAACLRVVEPETIHRKGQLLELIERLDAAVDRRRRAESRTVRGRRRAGRAGAPLCRLRPRPLRAGHARHAHRRGSRPSRAFLDAASDHGDAARSRGRQ